jgi:hypothetical protein
MHFTKIYSLMYLRCTLMDFERNYQISIPSNQIIIHTFTKQIKSPRLKFKKRCFHIHSKNLFLASKYETQIFSPLPKKGDVIESLQKLEP